jgi:hypothetical protein
VLPIDSRYLVSEFFICVARRIRTVCEFFTLFTVQNLDGILSLLPWGGESGSTRSPRVTSADISCNTCEYRAHGANCERALSKNSKLIDISLTGDVANFPI